MITIKKFQFKEKEFLEIAHAIRHKVFVIEQKCPKELEWEFEDISTHYILYNNHKAVATARYRKTKEGFKLERFAVLRHMRGKGFGHRVLNEILKDLKNLKEKIYMHAQSNVILFYEKMGFIKEGEEFEEAGIMHFKMRLKS